MRAAVFAALLAAWVAPADAQQQQYLVRPGDTLEVSVIEDPSLDRSVLVRPDGRISLPLAGTIEAADQTTGAIETAIRSALRRDFVTPPTVSVAVRQLATEEASGTARIYVIGSVNSPGLYQIDLPARVLQVLALSSGLTPFAAGDRIQVRRRGAAANGAETVFLFDYDAIDAGLVPSNDIDLRDGDVIVVPERGLFD